MVEVIHSIKNLTPARSEEGQTVFRIATSCSTAHSCTKSSPTLTRKDMWGKEREGGTFILFLTWDFLHNSGRCKVLHACNHIHFLQHHNGYKFFGFSVQVRRTCRRIPARLSWFHNLVPSGIPSKEFLVKFGVPSKFKRLLEQYMRRTHPIPWRSTRRVRTGARGWLEFPEHSLGLNYRIGFRAFLDSIWKCCR